MDVYQTYTNMYNRPKLGLYSTYIVPVLTYASETWTLSKSDEALLAAFERKMLRRILGPVCVEGQWRSRYNDELYEMYGDLTVVQYYLGTGPGTNIDLILVLEALLDSYRSQ